MRARNQNGWHETLSHYKKDVLNYAALRFFYGVCFLVGLVVLEWFDNNLMVEAVFP